MLVVRPLVEEQKPSGKKAFLLSGAFNPYTIGHEEAARQAAHYARKTGHTHLYHGLGSSANTEDAPLSGRQKRKIVRASQKHIKKTVKGIKMGVLATQHDSPFKQVLHLAKTGHSHVTLGLGSDQMKKKGLRGALERHVAQHGGMIDQEGKVHPVKLSFKQMGKKRDERPLHRTELLGRLKKGDLSVAKAGHLRKAVRTGDTELARALMPKSCCPVKYGKMIQTAQSKIPAKKTRKKKLTEGLLSFSKFITEAPELDPYIEPGEVTKERFNISYLKKRKETYAGYRGTGRVEDRKFVGHRRMGDIHPDYEMWKHTTRMKDSAGKNAHHQHQFSIVHKKTREKVGEIDAQGGKINRITGEHTPSTKGKGLRIQYIGIHPDHSASKIGTSLAVAAYKHLHGKGHSIKSDRLQSFGGASVWDKLRKDKDVGHHVMYHDERDVKPVPAHKMDYGAIWQEHPSAQETTLVLHAKPRQRKKAVTEGLLSFSKFITEAPELDWSVSRLPSDKKKFGTDYLRSKEKTYHLRDGHRFVKHENLGEIHPDYELHRHVSSHRGYDRGRRLHSHQYTIVHKKTGDVAGEIDASAGKIDRKTGQHTRGKGKGLAVKWVQIHPDHSAKKAGTSLAVAAYKHLHRLGHSIKSDTVHSYGGASTWDKLRHDPDVKHHVRYHDENHEKSVPAHKVDYSDIWREDGSGTDTTLVLHAKPRQRKKAVTEDIELIPVQRDRHAEKPRKAADVHKGYATKDYSSDKIVTKKNLGEIHPGYDLHHHSRISRDHRGRDVLRHQFTIVHRASGDIAGEMHARGGKLHPTKGVVPGPKGKGLKVTHLEVHPDHSSKKVGTSLAVEMYRHLHRRGHAIQSDAIQSHGAAHVWNTMRNDRELKKHMMIHSNREPLRGELHTFEKRAHRRPERHIWYQHSRNWSAGREKVEGSHGDEPDEVRTLVLSGKKRRKKVTEDIEMANILSKPHGGYHRDFAKMIERRGDKPKRSGRIAKGYTIHTSTDKDDPTVQTHYIVHDDTNHVAGEVTTRTSNMTGDHEVIHTDVHGDHTKKKIGKSLAMLAYKHLARKKGNLHSSNLQSPGGASIWNRLRKDPKMKGKIFHKAVSGQEVPAHDLPDKRIWAAGVKIERSKSTPGYLPASERHRDREHENILRSRLVIRPAKKS